MTVCYRHADRPTALRCTQCHRYVCAECLRPEELGGPCPDCAQHGAVAHGGPTYAPARTTWVPLITYGLIALNVACFIGQQAWPGRDSGLMLWSPAVADGQFYRLLTAPFLHYGPMHLLLNMWTLYVVGPPLERVLGQLRFSALYLLSALGGSAAVYLLAPPNTLTAGASGAIFGLFGAMLILGRRMQMELSWVAVVIIANLIFTFTVPHVSWQGHIGGLITGLLAAAAFLDFGGLSRIRIQAAATVALLLLLAGLIWWRTAELVS